jgi:GT2 family glycosyltransferase
MERIFIGMPVLNRLDLLDHCIGAIDYPAEILVVNNNSVDVTFKQEIDQLAELRKFTVLHQKRNLGVAASWNLIIRTALAHGHEWIFIGSNDTVLHSGSLKAAVEFKKEKEFGVWHLHAFNFFLLHRATVERVGWFDENFYPAYKEDQDYCYRCHIATMRRLPGMPGCRADHVGSATIRSDARYAARNQETHAWNARYYQMKWGGDAGSEKFEHPFNNPNYDHRWWAVPENNLARDWDHR